MNVVTNIFGMLFSGFIGYVVISQVSDGNWQVGWAILILFFYCVITYVRKESR